MSVGREIAAEEGDTVVQKKIAEMDALLKDARRLVDGTEAIFQRNGFSRKQLSEIAIKTGVAALGAQMRKEETNANAPKKVKKKRSKRAKVRI